MKKLFALAFVAGTFALVSCGSSEKATTAVDTAAVVAPVDTVAAAPVVDTMAAKVDTAAAKMEKMEEVKK
ncbi:MAG TPA: hypothetical protein VK766_06655 [Cytophagaceae bacterium]|jgi:hypothetical protein|nr:hypothetical protein [Cytophagaceae bacterium]